MKVTVVIPFCKQDQRKAEKLIEWIGELGGSKENEAVLVGAHDIHVPEFETFLAFSKSRIIRTPFALPDEAHPRGPNFMFETACKFMLNPDNSKNLPWLWLEPDAVPMRAGWLQMIEAEYELALKYKKKILAHVTELNDSKFPKKIPCGVAVYPADAWNYYRGLSLNRNVAWDIQFADKVMPIVHAARTLADLVNRKNPPTFAGPKALKVEGIPSYVALWHQCKDDSLINALRARLKPESKKEEPKEKAFYHSGDFGDIIYALPTVLAMGGKKIVLGPDNRSGIPARESIDKNRFEIIAPLLIAQGFDVSYAEEMPEGCVDLNSARTTIAEDHALKNKNNLAQSFLKHFKQESDLEKFAASGTMPWLKVRANPVAPVIIARSPRYHNPSFNWRRILNAYRGNLAFIGLKHEHTAFVKEFGDVPYHPTKDLLEAARVIAGSKLFIGNQSCPYAIAESLGVVAILEDFPTIPNCYFKRSNLFRGMPPELPRLPFDKMVKISRKDPLVIRGPVDMFSGFCQTIQSLANGMNERGYNVKIAPTMVVEGGPQTDIPPFPNELKKLMVNPETPGPVIISMHCGLPNLIQGGEVVMTMWESTRISPETCKALNAASRLIVPTEWGATSFNASGVNTPISIVPLGVDGKLYRSTRSLKSKPFVFGCAGRVAHGGMRKGIDDVVAAFLKAFPTEEGVRLQIKCFLDCEVVIPDDSRISIDRRFLPDLCEWYNSIHCFVSASRGEGWGLQPHQAMACGRPVISPRFSGISEFFDDSVGWPVAYSLVNAGGYYEGKGLWAEPDVNDMARIMGSVFRMPINKFQHIADNAADRANKFSIKNMVDHFERVLQKSGII